MTIAAERESREPIGEIDIDPRVLSEARRLFEVDSAESSYPITFLGYLYLRAQIENLPTIETADTVEMSETELLGEALASLYRILDIIKEKSHEGEDVFARGRDASAIVNRLLIERRKLNRHVEAEKRRFNMLGDDLVEDEVRYPGIGDMHDAIDDEMQDYRNLLSRLDDFSDAIALVSFLSNSRVVAGEGARIYRRLPIHDDGGDFDEYSRLDVLKRNIERSARYIREEALKNPTNARTHTLRQVRSAMDERFKVLSPVPSIEDAGGDASDGFEVGDEEILSGLLDYPRELDFTVLKGDTDLRGLAEEIFHESSDMKKAEVDIGRVRVLEHMRQLHGTDKCYIVRGKKRERTFSDDTYGYIDEDYIVLVMQHRDEDGVVVSEDALAISPISQLHAAYYARQDALAGVSWRELFALSKSDARDLGVRKLKFVATCNLNPYDAVLEKLFALAVADPEDFDGELRYDKEKKEYHLGKKRIRIAMAGVAIDSANR